MRISKCVFFLKKGEKYIAYNNLNFKLIELDEKTYKKLKEQEVEKQFDLEELDYLRTNKFLVEDEYDEIKARENIKLSIREKSEIKSHSSVSFIRISLTENCNLRCKYCFVNNIVEKKGSISKADFEKAINFIIENSDTPRVQYFGGEPLMRMDLIKLGHQMLQTAFEKKVIKSFAEEIVTNGTLLTEEKEEYFIHNEIGLIFSLDGWAEINDKNRVDTYGNGTFDIVIENITRFSKKGGMAGIILTPNQDNIDNLEEVVEFFVNEYNISNISINAPQPNAQGWIIDGKLLAQKIIDIYEFCENKGVSLSAPGMNLIHNLLTSKYQIFSCSNYGNALDRRWGIYLFSSGEVSYCLVEKVDECIEKFDEFKVGQRINDWHTQNTNREQCKYCIAYSVCGGMCSMEKCLISNASVADNKCCFNREIMRWGLLKWLKN